MRRSFIQGLAVLGLIVPAVLPGCAAPEEDSDSAAGAASEGLKERFADLRKVNTENLARITANAGAEAVNHALEVKSKYVELGVTVAPTQVFGAQAEENSALPAGAKVKGLGDIKAGLAKDFGENEFPTQLTNARLAYLATGADKYYVETGFGLRGAIGLSWSHDAGGFGEDNRTSIAVGFKKGKDVSTRIVVATPDSKLGELVSADGQAIMAMRGFVLPEKSENIKAMKPGEMVALRGAGTFAANFGVGIPILVANAGPFAYTVAVSAGLSHAVEGVLDVQLVRLAKDEVAVEVGISEGTLNAQSIGITGSFGVNTVCDDGAACLDGVLGKVVKNGLMSRLNSFLKTSVSASGSQGERRIQLARMRFHLDQPEVSQALAQALHGDLRYAQALYTRDLDKADPPVKFDFDMMRASTTNMRSFGADVFGIGVYHRYAVDKSGSFAVQTPNGVQSVLWSSFQKQGGWFQMAHGQKLTALSSASLDMSSPDKAINKANLIGQAVVGDKSMDDDVVLDSADALIAMLAGAEALAPLTKYGDAMQDAIGSLCAPTKDPNTDREKWDEACNVKLLQDETAVVSVDGAKVSLVEARKRGVDAFNAQSKITSLGQTRRELLAKAAELRLTLQMVKIHSIDATNGPQVSFALDYRLDDKALGQLAQVDGDTYKEGVRRYLASVAGARVGLSGGSALDEATMSKAADAMSAALAKFQKRYTAIAGIESNDLPSVLDGKPYIKLPIGIRFDVSDVADADGTERMKQFLDDTARIRVESMSHQRALLAVDLVNALVAAADDAVGFGNTRHRLFAEQAAAYTIIGVVPARNLEVGMDVSADVQNTFWMKRDRFIKAGFQAVAKTSRGADVEPITGKMFDLDAMMKQ
jgi:hypothetical protein